MFSTLQPAYQHFMAGDSRRPAPKQTIWRLSRSCTASSSALIMAQRDNGGAMLVIVEYWNIALLDHRRLNSKHSVP